MVLKIHSIWCYEAHSFIPIRLCTFALTPLLAEAEAEADDEEEEVGEEMKEECCRQHTVKLLHRAKMLAAADEDDIRLTIEMYSIRDNSQIW